MCVKCRTWNFALEPGPRGEEDSMHAKPNRLEQCWALWLVLSWWHNRRNNGCGLVIQLLPLWDWQELDHCCSFLSRSLRPSWSGLTLGCHGAADTEPASGLRHPQLSVEYCLFLEAVCYLPCPCCGNAFSSRQFWISVLDLLIWMKIVSFVMLQRM